VDLLAPSLKDTVKIASEMHSNASRGPPSCCLRAYIVCFTRSSKSANQQIMVGDMFLCVDEILLKSAVLGSIMDERCALVTKIHAFFFFFFLGGRAIHYTYMYVQRKKPQVSNGRPSTAEAASYVAYTLTTWVEADTKVCQEATCQAKQAAYKAVVHQPTAKPVHFQQTKHHLRLNQPNIAVKIISIMKCQAKQAADKTVVHHQPAKLASFH